MIDGILTPGNDPVGGGDLVVGDTFTGFLQEVVNDDARDSVRASAINVLEGALSAGPSSTGLVVGRVQSGKTLSYEGVIALARDNGFSLVIVISGISNPLLTQGERRLKGDLGSADKDGWLFAVPNDKQQSLQQIEQALQNVQANWSKASTPKAYKQTAVVVLLKHHGGILNLTGLFDRVDFSGQRVLIIDDEADQASLNTLAKKGKQSATYGNLLALRDSLPGHYYLQYTATPQAPLLIAIDDALSPDFVRVLEPGVGYTGGDRYFGSADKLVKTIGAQDLAAADHPNGPPPEGLRQAMLEFLIGVAHVVTTGKPKTRSMLVHPSRQKDSHADFVRWITGMKKDWQDKYEHQDEVFPVKLQQEFRDAWNELATTHPAIATFDECWDALDIVFRNLNIVEVNTRQGQTPVINWIPTQSYILVGGQAIDRGFTVEGLTVTYMPRGPGTRTADTVQQRARFFGYKASYLGLCRVYLESDVRDDFEMYVEHEKDMLAALRDIEAGNESLKEWKRQFLLDNKMKATRASVISIPMIHVKAKDRWIADTKPVRDDAPPLATAHAHAIEALTGVEWTETPFGHRAGYATLTDALELLVQTSPESWLAEPNVQALLLNLSKLQDDEPTEAVVRVVWMRPDGGLARRQLTSDGGVQLFQGRNASGYYGDRDEFDPAAPLTIQLHEVEVVERGTKRPLGEYLVTAWRIPEESRVGWLIEVGT
ncbi:Z1 domain-containing protein [Microbacterium sp. NPDC089189]|uniref:Z1 domain-containing protein n=1 Tax=Microbacterium sp. NPDC089189 TaxID=3154972 RepID=UPI00343B44C1